MVIGILFVSDFVKPGLLSFQEICKLVGNFLGNFPSRIIEYNAVHASILTFLRKSYIYNVLTNALHEKPVFHSEQNRTVRDLRLMLVNRKVPEPCAKGFWNRKHLIDLDKDFWLKEGGVKNVVPTHCRCAQHPRVYTHA